jgi:hypothetical protein
MIWRIREDGHSLWGAVHDGGNSSRVDRRPEAVPVVASSDLRAVEVRGTRATLLKVLVNQGMAEGGLPSVRHRGCGSRAA